MSMREILFLTNSIILLFYLINLFISVEEFNKKIDCSLFWTAIIVPYRNRSNQLPYFVHAIHKHNIYNNFKNVSINIYVIIFVVVMSVKNSDIPNFFYLGKIRTKYFLCPQSGLCTIRECTQLRR